ncbi:MAG TPA: hypothetical protein PK609_00155 [Candidatus Paceibacterota bacterium]|nr:hypothetical protein [Candidatus Paceibacterota bacterium]
MPTPSIETFLSRKYQDTTHPFARRLNQVPILGGFARAWIRTRQQTDTQSLWASLPPMAA